MRDYPIGSFLFWNVEKSRSKDFQFYDFIVDYNERDNRRIKKADISGEEDITAISITPLLQRCPSNGKCSSCNLS